MAIHKLLEDVCLRPGRPLHRRPGSDRGDTRPGAGRRRDSVWRQPRLADPAGASRRAGAGSLRRCTTPPPPCIACNECNDATTQRSEGNDVREGKGSGVVSRPGRAKEGKGVGSRLKAGEGKWVGSRFKAGWGAVLADGQYGTGWLATPTSPRCSPARSRRRTGRPGPPTDATPPTPLPSQFPQPSAPIPSAAPRAPPPTSDRPRPTLVGPDCSSATEPPPRPGRHARGSARHSATPSANAHPFLIGNALNRPW